MATGQPYKNAPITEAIRDLSGQLEDVLPFEDEIDAEYVQAPFKIIGTIKTSYGRPVPSKPRRVSFDD